MGLRQDNIDRLDGKHLDVLVVGGGINGAVSAAVLAAGGADVALVDRGDFGAQTSQESSNLVWGGFKYLENYEVPLVRKLCKSRNRLIDAYPTRIQSIGFSAALDRTSPHPPWLGAIGAAAYWAIGEFATPRPRYLTRKAIERQEPVVRTDNVRGGIEYHDAYLRDNDARFVFSFVRRALDSGAVAANYVEVASARRDVPSNRWRIELADRETGSVLHCTADMIVNAAGPWVDGLNEGWGGRTDHRIVYSKGVHLVVPRITEGERVLAFYDDTERLFYVIPMGGRSVIGTTDTRVDAPETSVTDEDRTFLLDQINARLDLARPLTAEDIIAERSGVRPLVVGRNDDDKSDIDWTTLSRKHEIEVDPGLGLVTIFGGKLTDCINVGEEVAEAAEAMGLRLDDHTEQWFGEPSHDDRKRFEADAATVLPDGGRTPVGLDREPLIERLWRRHGNRANTVLDLIRTDAVNAQPIPGHPDLLRGEVELMARDEMIVRLDDFLRRRTMLSLVHRRDELVGGTGLV